MFIDLYLAIAPISVAMVGLCLAAAVRFRRHEETGSLAAFLGLIAWYIFCDLFAVLLPDGDAKRTALYAASAAMLFLPVPFLSFLFRLAGGEFPRSMTALMATLSAAGAAFIFSNGAHGLYWTEILLVSVDGYVLLFPRFGPLYWTFLAVSSAALSVGIFAALGRAKDMPSRRVATFSSIALLLPGTVGMLRTFDAMPGYQYDFTPIAFAIAAVAITARIVASRFLRLLPVTRSAIIDELDSGVALLSRNGVLLDANEALARFAGIGPGDVGTHVSALPQLELLMGSPWAGLPDGGTENRLEHRGRALSVKTGAMSDSAGRKIGCVVTVEDETDRLRQEESICRFKAQMMRSEKLAAIGQVAAGVAHEINNPLGYVTSGMRSLKIMFARSSQSFGERNTRKASASIAVIEENLGMIESVVRSLLAFARGGGPGDAPVDCDLDRCVSEVVAMFGQGIGAKSMRTSMRTSLGGVPRFRARVDDVRQVVFALVSNAVRAVRGDAGGSYMEIRTGVEGGIMYCEVVNDGPPIPEEDASRIFEPFFTTDLTGECAGLGLSVARDVAERRLGGRLELVSRAGPVAFRLCVPRPS